MKRLITFVAAALALAACASSSTPQSGTLEVAPLAYTTRTLANGLRVYAMPDRNTANVSVQVWYDVGSVDDPAGRSGFAHLFEHIMFKSTRNMPEQFFDRLTEDVGGYNNASTYDDFTNYYEVVPANHLQRVLWAEADRMGSLVVNEESFDSERDVVKEELRQRVLASPYGRLFYLFLPQVNYDVHPYGRPGIGSIEDLDAATVADVRAFHAQYYRPDNAILVVSGNFDQAQLDAWVDQYFGDIASPDRAIPRDYPTEPVRTQPREYTVYAPNVPLPAVMISYPQPAATDPDIPVLMVIDGIMSTGENSRLYNSLVYDQQIAAQVFTNLEATQDPGAYGVFAILSDGQSAEAGQAALAAQIARFRDTLVTQAELEEAKNEIVTATLQGRETAEGRADELADSVIRYGDAGYADRLLAAIQATTAADVQRVARRIFDENRRAVVRYLPEEQGRTGDTIQTSSRIQARTINIPASEITTYTLAPEGQREQPPTASTPIDARIPAASQRTLANGVRVIVAPNRDIPLISADFRVASGSASDPANRAGVASMTGDLLTRGTTTRSATEIASQIESLGASIGSGAGWDSSAVSLQTRSDRAQEAFTVFADVVRNPAFAAEELDRAKSQALDGLQVALSQPGGIASFAMTRAIYGTAPYGAIASPTTLGAITRDDMANYHSAYWRPDNAVLVITGDVSAQEGFALAENYFGNWARPSTPLPPRPDATAYAAPSRTIVVDLPDTGQAAVLMGLRGVARTDADYFPLLVANNVLGGGYSARLNTEIRIRRGLSYGANSSLQARMAPGPIIASAQTRNDAAVQVYDLMRTEITRIGAEPVPVAELTARKAVLIGSFGRTIETTAGLAGQISTLALYGLPPERLGAYVADVTAVTPAQAQAAAQRYFDANRADVVVVGDAQHFYDGLRRVRPNAERIPASELNLDTESLR
ncbi:M16 family metallopeptidase [Candidatus Viadribacter manganicus]|uniref:Peptidase M16 n=1 Tax=Candidatus Viadribacter manganicus TaxID=1759059 RepID=A0A1B1AFS2_9PROT|nr:pitrilysin family protein [Candidatus Viadribacter manganicus]ANP45391.1 peptidase M16 [Candidatus Viadribacter manganicus]